MVYHKLLKAIRLHDWWHFIIPPIMGFYFLGVQYPGDSFDTFHLIYDLCKLFFLAVPVAAFGFFLNEWTDIKEDELSGKKNHVTEIKPEWRPFIFFGICIYLILAVLIPDLPVIIKWLVGLQILLFVLYSSPYIRLKEWPVTAIILDASYSGTLFYVIALLLTGEQNVWHLYSVFAFGMLRGFRNIIFHLQQDRVNDTFAGKKTIAHIISEKWMIIAQETLWILEVMIILPLSFYAGTITFAILLTGFLMILIKRHFYVTNRSVGNKDNLKWLGELNTLYELWFLAATVTGVFLIKGWIPLILSWLALFFIFPYTRKIFNELYIGIYNLYYFLSDLYFVYTKPHFDIGKILRRVFK